MRRIYFTLLVVALVCNSLSAQKKSDGLLIKKPLAKSSTFKTANRTAAGCDTINFPIPTSWNFSLYRASAQRGFVTGTNAYRDLEKAAYFDASGTSNAFIIKAFFLFGVANSNTPANLTKVVPFHLYDGDLTDGPKSILATVNKTLADLKANVDANNTTDITFPANTALPASKKFFVSVDLSNLAWDTTSASSPRDSLAVISTSQGDVLMDDNGIFYERWDNSTWNSGLDGWNLDANLVILPVIGATANCGTLPITLSSFTGERLNAKNLLKWTTATEVNNKGFDLQRSADGINFSGIGFISSKAPGGTTTNGQVYTYDDIRPLKGNNFYRLKQIDKDGTFSYSSVVLIKGSRVNALQISLVYPNPVKNLLNMVINAPSSSKLNLTVTDLAGKVVLQKPTEVLAGDNTIRLNIAGLAAGSYVVKALCNEGCEMATSRFVKH